MTAHLAVVAALPSTPDRPREDASRARNSEALAVIPSEARNLALKTKAMRDFYCEIDPAVL